MKLWENIVNIIIRLSRIIEEILAVNMEEITFKTKIGGYKAKRF